MQSNFHDYRVLRMNEAPLTEVHIVERYGAPPELHNQVEKALAGIVR